MDAQVRRQLLKDLDEGRLPEDLSKDETAYQEKIDLVARTIIEIDMINPGIVQRVIRGVFGHTTLKIQQDVMGAMKRIHGESN